MSEMMKPVSRIAELREQANLTQRELSLMVGVTENTIQNWERGRALVDQIQKLILLCEVLECNVKDLVPPEEEKPRRSLEEVRNALGIKKPSRHPK